MEEDVCFGILTGLSNVMGSQEMVIPQKKENYDTKIILFMSRKKSLQRNHLSFYNFF